MLSMNNMEEQIEKENGGGEIDLQELYPSISDWISIYTKEQLKEVGKGRQIAIEQENGQIYIFSDNANYVLKNDIDLSGENWIPLGEFKGIFVGNNKKILNLTIDISAKQVGLFSKNSGTIQYLGLEDSNINNNHTSNSIITYTGGIAGDNSNGTINKCYNTGTITAIGEDSAYTHTGGIAGNNGSGTISNCYNTGRITGNGSTTTNGNAHTGGIAGSNAGIISNCYNIGEITGTSSGAYIGGIVGTNQETINNCYNTGKITGISTAGSAGAYTGGIAGDNSVTINNCYNTGKIIGKGSNSVAFTGGIVGINYSLISNCYNIGEITGDANFASTGGIVGNDSEGTINNCYNTEETTGVIVGGIVGRSRGTTISNCYSIGKMTGSDTYTGGIIGYNDNYGTTTIINCYWYKGTSSITSVIGKNDEITVTITNALELTLDQMKQQSSFTGFDFTGIWVMDEYPKLKNIK